MLSLARRFGILVSAACLCAGCALLGRIVDDPDRLCPTGMRITGWDYSSAVPCPICACREGFAPKEHGPGCAEPPPSPTLTPTPTPEPTPTPTPPPCEGLGLKIDARCAGSTPGCGIPDPPGYSKAPRIHAGTSVWFDATYFLGQPGNEVHKGAECYPGPVLGWSDVDEVDCNDCWSDCHDLTCYAFTDPGSYTWLATGSGGVEASITVSAR